MRHETDSVWYSKLDYGHCSSRQWLVVQFSQLPLINGEGKKYDCVLCGHQVSHKNRIQKLQFLDSDTDVMDQFLGPETDIMG